MDLMAVSTLVTSPVTTNEPVNLSKKPISTFAALVAISAAIIAVSQGVSVAIPMAPLSSTPSRS